MLTITLHLSEEDYESLERIAKQDGWEQPVDYLTDIVQQLIRPTVDLGWPTKSVEDAVREVLDPNISVPLEIRPSKSVVARLDTLVDYDKLWNDLCAVGAKSPLFKRIDELPEDQRVLHRKALCLVFTGVDVVGVADDLVWRMIERTATMLANREKRLSGGNK